MRHVWVVMAITVAIAGPAVAQGQKPPIKPAAVRPDPCTPIGRLADGQLVYGMACDKLPAPAPAQRAEAPAPAAPPEEKSSGLFRNAFPSFSRPASDESLSNVGPSTGGR